MSDANGGKKNTVDAHKHCWREFALGLVIVAMCHGHGFRAALWIALQRPLCFIHQPTAIFTIDRELANLLRHLKHPNALTTASVRKPAHKQRGWIWHRSVTEPFDAWDTLNGHQET